MYPHQAESDFGPGDAPVSQGEWVNVVLNEPENIEGVNTMAARNWLERFMSV